MHAAATEIADTIGNFIGDVTPEVISMMLYWEPPAEIPFLRRDAAHSFSIGSINGSIGFGGRITGTLFFSVNDQQAAEMGEALLGHKVSVDRHECLDVVGELTNMIAGGIKTRLNDQGYPMVMSIPNIISGPSILVAGKDVEFKVEREFALGSEGTAARVIMIGRTTNG